MDYYKTLGLIRSATTEEIIKKYSLAAKNYTPEIAESEFDTDKFKQIFEAYYILRDDFRRKNYDKFYSTNTLESREFRLWRKNQFEKLRETKQDETSFSSLILGDFFGNIIVE